MKAKKINTAEIIRPQKATAKPRIKVVSHGKQTPAVADDLFELALETYDKKLGELLKKNRGRFVAIHGDRVLEISDSFDELYEKYHMGPSLPLLIRMIIEEGPGEITITPAEVIGHE